MPPWLIPTRRGAHGYGAFVTATETLDQRYVVEALPALLAARPLKRALGKYRSMIEVERVSQGHVRKRPRRSPACAGWKPTNGSCGRRCGAPSDRVVREGDN